MDKIVRDFIQVVLLVVMISGLTMGCEGLSSVSTAPASPYPADISGHVTIAEKVKSGTAIAVPPNKEGDIFWIVDVLVKNNAYDGPVEASLETGYKGWEIIANDKVYRPRASGSPKTHPPMSVALNKTGQFMLYVVVPDTLQISDAQICYRGQEPYSYGKLSGGDRVAAYDWDSKTVISEPKAVAEVENWKIQLDGKSWKGSTITVKLTITNTANRRTFGYPSDTTELAVIDSTGKLVKSWKPEPKTQQEFFSAVFSEEAYQGEYYPNESRTVELKFEMHPLSGQCSLYYGQYYWQRSYKLFDLGEPK